ncbi:Lag2p [Saccharomyces paradoxus]|uniref:Lag2p n=1 Tax=Saccharomyces paradoxus TaxID=27291 RepID=A0A8B8UZD5_SACPA|nr:Lag2 [Saccharomyces paradoxus]QHS76095.1 Lag2 [Saccharomyces paradoxus]
MSLPISKLIEQYRSTRDNDLKYMLLRRNFEINDMEDELASLINDLLLPVLVEEQDMEILNLVSFQVFPNLVLSMISNSTATQVGWVTSLICDPLLNQSIIHANRSFVLIETLRNILQKIENAPHLDYHQPVNNSFEFISKFIVEMKRHMCDVDAAQLSHSLSESNMLIYIESLNLLLKFSFFSDATCSSAMVTLPFDILNDVFSIAQDYSATSTNESIDRITEKLFLTSTQLTHPADLKKLCPKMKYNTLSVVSRIWYKFGPTVAELFTDYLLPVLLPSQIVEECSIEDVLEIIHNFHPYFSFRRLEDNRPLLSDSTISQLRKGLFDILIMLNDSLTRTQNESVHSDGHLVDSDDGFASDNDSEQQAYLDELMSEGYDENMYNGDTDNEDADDVNLEKNDELTKDITETNKILSIFAELHYPQEERFSELLVELQTKITINPFLIDKILSKETTELPTDGGELVDLNEILNEVKANKLTRKNVIFYTLEHTLSLKSCSDLSVLQLSIEVIDHLLVKNHSNNITRGEQFRLIKLILPHLKTNKSFIDTLKAGNFTQKIDEGVTLRTTIISLLLQLLPLDYSMLGDILPTIARYSVRDKDFTVRDLSLQLLNQVLRTYYNCLIGIDWEWYNNDFYQVLQETCIKKDIDTNLLLQFPPYFPHD